MQEILNGSLEQLNAVAFVVVGILSVLGAAGAATPFEGNGAVSVEPRVVQLEPVYEGEVKDLRFLVKNERDAPLDLGKVVSGCRCTTALQKGNLRVAPGGTGAVAVRFTVPAGPGLRVTKLRFVAKDTRSVVAEAVVLARVESELAVRPRAIVLPPTSVGVEASGRALVYLPNSASLRIEGVRTSVPWIVAALRQERLDASFEKHRRALGGKGGKSYVLSVRMAPREEPGPVGEFVELLARRNTGAVRSVKIWVRATVTTSLRFRPPHVVMFQTRGCPAPRRSAVLESVDGRPFAVTRASATPHGLKVSVVSISSTAYRVDVAMDHQAIPAEDGNTLANFIVSMSTTHPKQRCARLPVTVVHFLPAHHLGSKAKRER